MFGAGVVLQCRSSNLVHRLCLKPTLQLVWCEYDFLKVYPVVQRMPPFPCVGRFPSKMGIKPKKGSDYFSSRDAAGV